jgi:hypothetical protein
MASDYPICECNDMDCVQKLNIPLSEYEGLCQDYPGCWIQAPGHRIKAGDKILLESAHYTVVQDRGDAVEVPKEFDGWRAEK